MEDQFLDQDIQTNEAPREVQEQPVRNTEQENWKRMREEREKYKKEAEEYKQMLDQRGDDEEFVERKHLRQMQLQLEKQTLELRIKSKFKDFDDVVTEAAIEKLAREEPELAMTLHNAPDMYTKAVTAYKLLKNNDQKPRERSEDEYEMWERELGRQDPTPRSTHELSLTRTDRPISSASAFQNGLTKELKDQLYREMQDSIKARRD